MKTLKIKLKGTTKIITAKQVAEHFANEICDRYGWGRQSSAWHDLAAPEKCVDGFLLKHAAKMYPDAEVSWENIKEQRTASDE